MTDALEGADFTPVYFPRNDDKPSESKLVLNYSNDEKYDIEKHLSPVRKAPRTYASLSNRRGSSVYSDSNDSPIIMSSSAPLISDLSAPGDKVQKEIRKTLRKSRIASGRVGALSGWGREEWSPTSDSSSDKGSPLGGSDDAQQEREIKGVRDLVDLRRPPAAAVSDMRDGRSDNRIPSFTTVSTLRPRLPGMGSSTASSEQEHTPMPTPVAKTERIGDKSIAIEVGKQSFMVTIEETGHRKQSAVSKGAEVPERPAVIFPRRDFVDGEKEYHEEIADKVGAEIWAACYSREVLIDRFCSRMHSTVWYRELLAGHALGVVCSSCDFCRWLWLQSSTPCQLQ